MKKSTMSCNQSCNSAPALPYLGSLLTRAGSACVGPYIYQAQYVPWGLGTEPFWNASLKNHIACCNVCKKYVLWIESICFCPPMTMWRKDCSLDGQWGSARHISNSNCWSEQVPSTWRRVLGHAISLGIHPHAFQYLGSFFCCLILLYMYVLQSLGSWFVSKMHPSSIRQLMVLFAESYMMFISTWEPAKEHYLGLYPGSLKGLSHEIFTVIFWLEWIYLGLNENRYWFLNLKRVLRF